jgi:hypothetical protein
MAISAIRWLIFPSRGAHAFGAGRPRLTGIARALYFTAARALPFAAA